jgi:ubiquinone/menaquinone biosynthesis C-methylase UbiE
MQNLLAAPLFLYSATRSTGFTVQYQLLEALNSLFPHAKRPTSDEGEEAVAANWETILSARRDLMELLREDSRNITRGLYPLSVLKPESPVGHMLRLPRILADGLSIYARRKRGRTTEFTRKAEELLSDLPRYYRRNFHFQTDGYLSARSAELYEHQVEMLFGGAADAMRRLIVTALRERFGSTDGRGLRFLEVAAGTGRSTRFVHLAFPKARIVATDLSEPYLRHAQSQLRGFSRIDYMQADGAKLPFLDRGFDAVYSVFLFHELPEEARREVLREAKRVLKPGGFFGLVDSIQRGDKPEFDPLLARFPKDFHEPFYRNYSVTPMEGLLAESGFTEVESRRGFFSKVISGTYVA